MRNSPSGQLDGHWSGASSFRFRLHSIKLCSNGTVLSCGASLNIC